MEHFNQIQELNNNLGSLLKKNEASLDHGQGSFSSNWSSDFIENQIFENQYSQYLNNLNLLNSKIIEELKLIFDQKLEKIYNKLNNLYSKFNDNTDLLLNLNKLIKNKVDSTLELQNIKLEDLVHRIKFLDAKTNENILENIVLKEKLQEYGEIILNKLNMEDLLSINENLNKNLEELSSINQKLMDLFNSEDLTNFSLLNNELSVTSDIFKIPSVNEPSNILPPEIIEFIKNLFHIEDITIFYIFCILLLMISFITISATINMLYIKLSLKYRGLIWEKLPQWIKSLYEKLPKWLKFNK